MSSPRQIVFWGATGQAKVMRELLQPFGYRVVAVFDNDRSLAPPFGDVSLHFGDAGFEAWLRERPSAPDTACLATIGGARGRDRLDRQQFMEARGFASIVAVHQTAIVAAGAVISSGCQILARATVCVDARLGRSCIVNTAASIDHECVLGDGVHVGPGATLAGCVSVGECSFIGTGAIVLPRVRIGGGTIIGAGSVVTRDIPDGVVAYGSPARVMRKNS